MTKSLSGSAAEVINVPLGHLCEANYRKSYGAESMDELVGSIRAHGVRQPVLVRPAPSGEGFQLVYGHRRARAARAAGLEVVPAFVAELSDEEARELQLVENSQREDPHPLDEADALRELLETYGRSIEELSARTGKSHAHVWRRLKLCALGDAAREAFAAGKVSAGVAELVATIPELRHQEEVVQWLTGTGEAVSVPSARRHIQERYQRMLATAPFHVGDASLLDGVPSCGACPRRTGAAATLFGDVSGADDRCTDSGCFAQKREAAWTRALEDALANGHEVLDEDECRKLYPYSDYLGTNAPYVDLAEACQLDPKKRTWGAVLGRDRPPVSVARDARGKVHKLVLKVDAQKLLQEAAPSLASSYLLAQSGPVVGGRQLEQQQRRESERRRAVVRAGMATIVAKVQAMEVSDSLWRYVASGFFQGSWSDVVREVTRRRGLEVPKGGRADEVLEKHIEGLSGTELLGVVVECLATRCAVSSYSKEYGTSFVRALDTFGVDLRELESAAAAQAAAPKAGKQKKGLEVSPPAEAEERTEAVPQDEEALVA